jgi:hypothetical protein
MNATELENLIDTIAPELATQLSAAFEITTDADAQRIAQAATDLLFGTFVEMLNDRRTTRDLLGVNITDQQLRANTASAFADGVALLCDKITRTH